MRKNTNRLGLIGAGVGVAALAAAGFALPANAADWNHQPSSSSSTTQESTDFFDGVELGNGKLVAAPYTSGAGILNAPLVQGPLVSDVANGDVASGNAVVSGNDIPVVSGNDVPVASGNDVQAPVASGNDVGPVASGNDTGVEAPVGSGNQTDISGNGTGDIGADVSHLVDSVTDNLDVSLDGILGR